jgi:hypothetical protein
MASTVWRPMSRAAESEMSLFSASSRVRMRGAPIVRRVPTESWTTMAVEGTLCGGGTAELCGGTAEQQASSLTRDLVTGDLVMADGRWWRPGAVSGDTRPCGASGTWYVTMTW